MFFGKTEERLQSLGAKLLIEFARELEAQDHKATGRLLTSLEFKIIVDNERAVLEILWEDYGNFVNTGRKRGGKKVPIQALMEWIRVKGIASFDKEVRSIAFAIQTKIFREGIPTRTSAGRGNRTGWVDNVLKREEQNILRVLEESLGEDIQIVIDTNPAIVKLDNIRIPT